MDNDIQVLGERVSRLVEISRKLADENRTLKSRLEDAMAASPLWDPIYEGPTTTLYELSEYAKGPQEQ